MATSNNINDIKYDINQSYGVSSYDTSFSKEIDAIEQSITNILITPVGTRLRNREFGSSLYKYLFKPMNDRNADSIMDEIISAIGKYETRVKIIVSECEIVLNYTKRQYEILLSYVILRSSELRVFRFAVDTQE